MTPLKSLNFSSQFFRRFPISGGEIISFACTDFFKLLYGTHKRNGFTGWFPDTKLIKKKSISNFDYGIMNLPFIFPNAKYMLLIQ